MSCSIRNYGVIALALLVIASSSALGQQGYPVQDPANPAPAQNQTQTQTAPAPATVPDEPPSKPDKNAPSPSTLKNIDAIGNRNVGCNTGAGNWYSLEKQVAMGQQYSQQVEHGVKLVQDPVITEYVNRIGQNLVRNSDSKVPFTIKVIDTDEINAFALPGGFFYVNSGLILAADNEAELAGVMAHEIAHVAARHATRNMTKGQIWNMASIPLMFVGGPAGYAIAEIASIAVPMSFLKFSRDSEREADMLGLQGPAGMPEQTVRTLETSIAKILKDPAFANRLAVLGMNISEQGSAQYASFMEEDLKRYSAIVDRLHLRPN